MIRISQLKLKIPHTEEALTAEIARRAYGQKPVKWKIVRRSVDARRSRSFIIFIPLTRSLPMRRKCSITGTANGAKSTRRHISFPSAAGCPVIAAYHATKRRLAAYHTTDSHVADGGPRRRNALWSSAPVRLVCLPH